MLLPVVLAAFFISLSWAQFTRVDYSGRKQLSVATVGEYLFVHGGEPKTLNDTSNYETTVLHLKQSWPSNSPTQAPINWLEQNGTRTTVRSMLGYQVWGYKLWKVAASNSLLSWGGFRMHNHSSGTFDSRARLDRGLWRLETDVSAVTRWELSARPTDANDPTADSTAGNWGPGWGASVACADHGVYLGGLTGTGDGAPFGSGRDAGRFTAGMISYDMAKQTFANLSIPQNVAAGALAGGEAVCIPHLGQKGLVMFLGGYQAPAWTTLGSIKTGGGATPMTFDQLAFYDPVAGTWATQRATGDIPESRSSFCAVGVKGKNGTFEVFISGGDTSPDQGKDTGNVYMLSIPAMNWWRISQTETAISGHACEVVGKRYMVRVGGTAPPPANGQTSTSITSGVTLFDMASLEGASVFDPDAADYTTAEIAQTWYADAKNLGGVQWTDASTQALLTGQPTTNSNNTTSQGQSGSPSAGLIAGAVVGAVVGLALLAAAALLFKRRRDRAAAAEKAALLGGGQPQPGAAAGYADKPEMDGSAATAGPTAATHAKSPELDGHTPLTAHSELDSSVTTRAAPSAPPTAELGGWSAHSAAELYGSPIPEVEAQSRPQKEPAESQKVMLPTREVD